MLMLHTAGIRDSLELIRLAGIDSAADTDKANALQPLFAKKSTNFTTGTAYTYSNGGYLPIAELVERVYAMQFADYAQTDNLRPLGRTARSFMKTTKTHGH